MANNNFHIDGISIDYELKKLLDKRDAEVHSVFKKACNLKTSNGEMISIISKKDFNGPNTVLISEGINLNNLINPGEKVICSFNEIIFEDKYINLKTCSLWKYNYRELILTKDMLKEYVTGFANILTGNLISDLKDTSNIVKKILYQAVEENIINSLSWHLSGLLLNLKENNKGRIKDNLSRIIGLGCGLTPAGDDIFVGILSVLHRLKNIAGFSNLSEIFLNSVILSIKPYMSKTNFISSALLGFSIHGRFSQFILELLDDLFSGIKNTLFLNKLLNYGESSGIATGLGIILGCSLFF